MFRIASVIAALAFLSPAHAEEANIAPLVDAMGSKPCLDSDFTCVTMMLPRDHFANAPDASLPVTFAISLATEPSKGTLIYAVGGPGGSGLQIAQDYVDALDPDFTAQINIVFFDQRGVGPDTGFSCVDAQAALDRADMPLDDPAATIATVQTYVDDCIAEIDDEELLKTVDTDQAIRDIEAFRQAIGAPKVWVYGESYGTQFAQEYATAFPTAIAGVILDGVVDLNLGFAEFYRSYTAASEKILERVFAECDRITACRNDMEGDAVAVYDALAARLKEAPVTLDFPLGSGEVAQRSLTTAMLENSAFYALYGPGGRADFLRALAAASRNDLIPMLRLGYSDLGVDSEDETGVFDAGYFPASYYAINCTDYAESDQDSKSLALSILADAAEYAKTNPRLLRTYYLERVVCAIWPHKGELERPAQFAGGDYPTLVMNSNTDPITPIPQAYAVFNNAKNAHMVVMQNGPHVIYGWGLACPDVIVSNLIANGTAPDADVQLCEQDLVGGYAGLTLTDPLGFADPLAVARGVEAELLQLPELTSWDANGSVAAGCNHGGTVTEAETDEGYSYAFSGCQMWPGLVVDGTGTEIWVDGDMQSLTLALDVSGPHAGMVTYMTNPMTEAWSISGTYDGKPLETPRPLP
jgi:pimeloyl-ACP methyl ester carboxylesterase